MFTRIADAAKQLSVSERLLRQLIAESRIPFYRLSERTLRVDLNELRDYMRLFGKEKANALLGSEVPSVLTDDSAPVEG